MNRTRRILLGTLLLGLLVRLAWIQVFSPAELTDDPFGYDRTACSILYGEGFRNGNFFAYTPPAYPYFLAGVYAIFGRDFEAAERVQAVLSMVTCLMIFFLARRLTNETAALIASLLFNFHPQIIRYSAELWSETLFFLFFTAGMYCVYRSAAPDGRKLHGAAAGLLFGLAALTREIMLYFLIPAGLWLVIVALRGRPGITFGAAAGKAGIMIIAAGAVILPWTIRNYRVFHKVVPITINGAINFYMGNNARATGRFLWALPPGVLWQHEVRDRSSRGCVTAELYAYRTSYREGMRFVRDNPRHTMKMAFKKAYYLWQPPFRAIRERCFSPEALFRLYWLFFDVLLLVFGMAGIYFSFGLDRFSWSLIYLWPVYITAIHVVTYASPRYFLAVVPVLVIFAALAIGRIAANRNTIRQPFLLPG